MFGTKICYGRGLQKHPKGCKPLVHNTIECKVYTESLLQMLEQAFVVKSKVFMDVFFILTHESFN